jgi:hypothetical protein
MAWCVVSLIIAIQDIEVLMQVDEMEHLQAHPAAVHQTHPTEQTIASRLRKGLGSENYPSKNNDIWVNRRLALDLHTTSISTP